jgi:polysaccharide export outer membrane protein
MNFRPLLLLSLLLLLTGSGVATAAPEAAPPGQPAAPAAPATRDPSYVLKPDDVLELSVFEEDDLAATTKILKTGEVVLPLIGTVTVGGLNLDAATAKVRGLYAAKYLVNPRVSLTVSAYGEQLVSVLGALKAPGTFPVPVSGSIDLASAIALAGGLADDADNRSITVIRGTGATTVYSKAQVAAQGGAVKLTGGDRVVVSQSPYIGKAVTILGRVMRPGPVEFPLDGNLDLVGAISRAGGFHQLANSRKVNVNRGGKVQVIDVRELSERGGRAFALEPGDVVTVPERVF